MTKSFTKNAKTLYMGASLEDFSISNISPESVDEFLDISAKTFMYLILYSPKNKNNDHYIKDREYYGIDSSKKIKIFLKEVIKVLNIEGNYYPFSSFEHKEKGTATKKNAFDHSNQRHYLFYYNSSSLIDSFFSGLRDALAHGNVFKKEKTYILFSTRKTDNIYKKEYIKFILSIDSLTRLDSLVKLLIEYRNNKVASDKKKYP